MSKLPEGAVPIGFQVAGYDEEEIGIGKTFLVKTGKTPRTEAVHKKGYGCTWGGDGRVIRKLWKEDPTIQYPNQIFFNVPSRRHRLRHFPHSDHYRLSEIRRRDSRC